MEGGEVMETILTTVKKLLGIPEVDDSFDTDILVHINTTNMILSQLGVKECEEHLLISDTDTWDVLFNGNNELECLKSYFYFSVKLAFDPPSGTALLESLNRMKSEIEWRIKNCVVRKEVT